MRSPATCMLVLAIFRISSLNAMTVKSAVPTTLKTDATPTNTKETAANPSAHKHETGLTDSRKEAPLTNANTANEAISFDHVQPIGVMQETQPVQPNGVMQKPQPSLPTQTGYALDTGLIANVLTELLAAPATAAAAIGHNIASANNEISAELELDAQMKGKLTITGNQLHGLNNNEIYNLMQYLGRA